MLITRPMCIQWKFTTPYHCSLLVKNLIFFLPLSSVHLFQSNSWTDTFRKSSKFNFSKLSSQNVRGFDQATILSPSFHSLSKERLTQLPLFVYKIRRKTLGSTSRKVGWGCATPFLKPLPCFRKKSLIFPTLFQTSSKNWYPISYLKPWSPARDRSAWQAVTARTRLA